MSKPHPSPSMSELARRNVGEDLIDLIGLHYACAGIAKDGGDLPALIDHLRLALQSAEGLIELVEGKVAQ